MSYQDKSNFSDQLVEQYFSDLRQTEMLSDEEFLTLFTLAKTGEKSSFLRIIEANLKLVISIAKHYAHNKLMFLDLVQEGNIGLIKSIKKFDPTLGYKFSTFSSFWIKQEIIRSIENKGRIIRVPVNVSKTIQKLKKLVNTEVNAKGEIDKKTIAATVKIREEKIEDLMQYFDDSCSIEKLIDKNCFNIFITDAENLEPEDLAVSHIASEQIQNLLRQNLTTRERETITLRFGLGDNVYKTHQQVAEMLMISRERVRQLEMSALGKLRGVLCSNPEFQMLFSA
ncbi:MAG TPA: RNA polymerase sigma factor RpoD/SigA [Candidatus Wallbacteria bacterium]|mgnify:CR=1 FL=1|nr:RNA polymerase sigma factor RpoD/SigA [Candidatus Wallbacteria bacterium]